MKNSAQFFTAFAMLLVVVLYVLLYVYTNWSYYLMWVVSLGMSTFVLFGIDKLQAMMGNWRIPELTLLSFVLLGGFGGGWPGMLLFWHKIRKPLFWIVLIASTVIYLILFQWL